MIDELDIDALAREGREAFTKVKAHPAMSLLVVPYTAMPGLLRRALGGEEQAQWYLSTVGTFMDRHGGVPFNCCLCGETMDSPLHAGAIVVLAPEMKPGADAAVTCTCLACGNRPDLRESVMAMAGVGPVYHDEGHA